MSRAASLRPTAARGFAGITCTARNALFRLNLFPQGLWLVGYRMEQGKGTTNNANNANAGCSDIASSLAPLAMHARDLRFLRCLRFPLLLADPA
jgi:hypothetical protein